MTMTQAQMITKSKVKQSVAYQLLTTQDQSYINEGLDKFLETKVSELPITLNGVEVFPDAEGMYSLNELHKASKEGEGKRPSQWRNAVAKAFEAECKIARRSFKTDLNETTHLYATEDAAIAYSIWVDVKFYMMVVQAFVALRNSAMASAIVNASIAEEGRKYFADNSPKTEAYERILIEKHQSWNRACKLAGIRHPNKFMALCLEKGRVVKEVQEKAGYKKRIKVLGYNPEGKVEMVNFGDKGSSLQVTRKGVEWMKSIADEVNQKTKGMKMPKKKSGNPYL